MKFRPNPLKRLQHWIEAVDLSGEDQDHLAVNAQWLAIIVLLACGLALPIYLFVLKQPNVARVLLMTAALAAGVIILVRRRHVTVANLLLLVAFLALLTYQLYMANGVRSITVTLYPVLIIFAAMTLSRHWFVLYTGLVLLSVGYLVYAQSQGWATTTNLEPASFAIFLVYTVIFGFTAVIARMLNENLFALLAQSRLRERELATQKTMLDCVGQAIVGCEMDNTIVYWNRAATKVYGWSAAEVLGRKFHEVAPASLPPEMTEAIRAALRAGNIWSGEYTVRRRDGTSIPVIGTLTPIQNEHNGLRAWVGIGTDLTEHKQIEEELRQREAILEAVTFSAERFLKTPDWRSNIDVVLERLGTTIQATHAYVFVNHLDTTGVQVSSMHYEWTAPGYVSDLGNTRFQNTPLRHEDEGHYDAALERGEAFLGNAATFSPQARMHFAELGVQAVLEMPLCVNEQWWGTIGFDDMAQDRAWAPAEVDALKIAAGILSAAIQRQEADAALQRELGARKELIEELRSKNEELERFTYTVSHDLKSPLITIRGFLGFAEKDALAGSFERMQSDFTRIREATDKMQRLLSELLELSRIGRLMNPLAPTPLEAIVREALEATEGCWRARGIQVELAPALPVVHGDRARLTAVLQNLIDNACKFMGDQAEPRITIGVRGTDRAGNPIVFVQDNGIGIDPQYHDRVFGLFDKLNAQSDGTGVGLALCKRIVEVHGGRIWVESQAGRGAAFCFTLPAASAA